MTGKRSDQFTPGAPSWITLSIRISAVAALSCLYAAYALSGRIQREIETIGSSHTVFGWRNEPAIEEAVRTSREIGRFRTWRSVALSAAGLLVAGTAGLSVAAVADRRRRMTVISQMAREWKQDKAEEIRGFISRHVDTLAQKKLDLISKNAYGVVDDADWQRELTYFVNRVLRPGCGVDPDVFSFAELRTMVERQVSMLG